MFGGKDETNREKKKGTDFNIVPGTSLQGATQLTKVVNIVFSEHVTIRKKKRANPGYPTHGGSDAPKVSQHTRTRGLSYYAFAETQI